MTKAIFLDAAGTLFDVRGSVGAAYAKTAKNFGVEVESEQIHTAFMQSFTSAPPMAFPGVEIAKIPDLEFEWWQAVSAKAFRLAGVFNQFSDYSAFFAELYAHFATAEPWFVYPDVVPALNKWQQQGIELGVISNFDTRLYSVLKALNLAEYFTSVTISTEAGAAKPDSQIFEIALQKQGCTAGDAVHIGDSFKADYWGAKAAGLKAIWLNRQQEELAAEKLAFIQGKLEQCTELNFLVF
ncbi:MAG: HAD-IA family hydrolase [Oscillatoriaceae cyanobacterium Prado104]|jgi:putative hydrolase of the HAD superfamily|nr:HAD-IA family hydrolase [Oscillatoriaceae cyanobacterium Prado104]